MLKVATIEEAAAAIRENFEDYNINLEEISIIDSVGRTLSNDIVSNENIPNFNRSTVDGYAIRARDSFGAGDSIPSLFKVVGQVEMGEPAVTQVNYGEAVYVPTGGMVPEGADAVVMIEYVEKFGEKEIGIVKPAAPFDNIVSIGEDIKAGETVLKKGHILRPQDIGGLAGLGITKVNVFQKIKVGIISTGDEIVNPEEDLEFGKIRDINSFTLGSALDDDGCIAKLYGIIRDDFERLKCSVEQALDENDIVLISGGSSVGMKDVTDDVINSLGEPGVIIHGLQTKPGKPTIIGKARGKALFGLPGHPSAALMIYRVVVRKLIRLMCDQKDLNVSVFAQFSQNYSSAHGREEYVMVKLEKANDKYIARPIYSKSALIATMISADGYIRIEANKEGVLDGETVEVFLF